ncbi:684_t:CDS:2 [Ambispora leptoticha]|uniref:allantoinase n=1 Tax=Ambispora leptoticha TaxID=144679 RepID=A0A9N9FMW2_9GLOM|nr:684_t:CDS:2 [Ambispora leptoticha]
MSATKLLVITGPRVLTSLSTEASPGTLEIDQTGKITAIYAKESVHATDYPFLAPEKFIKVGSEQVVQCGLVDAHVHLNEPGRTAWEGFESGTRAACAGGVTTVIDMPLNSIPPTTTVPNLHAKIKAARDKCWVDVGFYGGNELVPLIKAGVKGFKAFMIESGVEEFPACLVEDDLRKAFEELKGHDSLFMFHAEKEENEEKNQSVIEEDSNKNQAYVQFLSSRPQSLELNAIKLIAQLTSEYQTVRTHIVHLSAADALPVIREAKRAGAPLTVETCFHYLCLTAEQVPIGATKFKCCPPIRDNANRELLWEALRDGTIDSVVSDHSPCTVDLKLTDKGDFMRAWGGISSLQFGLPVLWTEARKRGFSINDLHKWLSRNTAKQVRLDDRKGEIKVGFDADIVIWSPEETFTVAKENIQFKNKVTPYEGQELYGAVKKTILRGQIVFDSEKGGIVGSPIGKMLI